jgi:hypothetical protein
MACIARLDKPVTLFHASLTAPLQKHRENYRTINLPFDNTIRSIYENAGLTTFQGIITNHCPLANPF